MKKFLAIILIFCTLPAIAQVDRSEVRAGNRKFRRDRFKEAEIDYRKAALKDSLSVTAEYNLASALYRQQDYAGAAKALATVKENEALPAQYHYNAGDAALQQKDYASRIKTNNRTRIKIRIRIRTRISSKINRTRTRIRTRTRTRIRISRTSSRRFRPSRPSRCFAPSRPRSVRRRTR